MTEVTTRGGHAAAGAWCRLLAWAGVVLTVLAALVALLLGPLARDVLLHVVVGLVCTTGGAWLLARARPLAAPERRATAGLLGAAFVVYGAGMLVNATQPGVAHPEAPGDLLALAVTPLVLVAFATAPSSSRAALPVTRLLLDAVLLATVATLTVWELLLPEGRDRGPDRYLLLATLLGLAAAVAVPSLAAVRERGRRLPVLALLVVAFVVPDGAVSLGALGFVVPAWLEQAAVLWQVLVLVPLVVAAGRWVLLPPPRRDVVPDGDDDEGGSATLATAVSGGLLVAVLVGGGIQMLDPVALGLSVAVVVLVLGREVLLLSVLRRLVRRLTRQALVDPLTGLPNAQALAAQSTRRVAAVVAVDIAGLDAVNQVLGRAGGDALVRRVGALVEAQAPQGATCFRAGGDEFLLVLTATDEGGGALEPALAAAERLQEDARRGTTGDDAGGGGRPEDGVRLHVGVAAAAAGDAAPLAVVVEDALQALRTAQEQRTNRPVLHDDAQREQVARDLAVQRRLAGALARGDVTVHLQPIVDLRSGEVVAAEALARWHDEELGHVPPPEFVAAAERTGLIDDLGEHVLRTAVADADAAGLLAAGLRLTVNVSPLQLRHRRLLDVVRDTVAAHGVGPGRLALEVTESVLLDDDGPALWHLHQLVGMGVDVVIDDFGAGHASLGYLRRVPAATLKLDRGLVTSAAVDVRARAVLLAGLELCRTLGLTSVVEGVETQQVAAEMAGLGADLGQGWLWSRAVPAAELAAALGASGRLSARVGS
ncbi:bifunctional diguanylate cyclase/phosphodiesterase [Aquipuribacter sp. SD81]|uniref:bifunctional diguanylate cyclase/phosphodiesterase n=1 Tax=Aquipuribacter sp. SD81 TaxID=3127703 RepID=UPI00301A61EB